MLLVLAPMLQVVNCPNVLHARMDPRKVKGVATVHPDHGRCPVVPGPGLKSVWLREDLCRARSPAARGGVVRQQNPKPSLVPARHVPPVE